MSKLAVRRISRLARRPDVDRSASRGQVLVIFALLLTVMLSIMALSLDVGYGLVERRMAQNYADSAALAGAQTIGDNSPPSVTILDHDVYNAVSDVITATGLSSSKVSVTTPGSVGSTVGTVYVVAQYVDSSGAAISSSYASNTTNNLPSGADGLQATVTMTYSTFFAGVMNVQTVKVVGTATAIGQHVIPAGVVGLNPFAARWDPPFGPSNNPLLSDTNPAQFATDVLSQQGCTDSGTAHWQCNAANGSHPKITGITGNALGITRIPAGTVFTVYDNGTGWQSVNTGPSGVDNDWNTSASFKGFFDNGLVNNCWSGNSGSGEGVAHGRAPTVNAHNVAVFPLIDAGAGTGSHFTGNIYGIIPLYVTNSGTPMQGTLVSSITTWTADTSCGTTTVDTSGQSPFISVVLLK